eukprot:CAMPEP_0171168916 /NCGR_PEP_ID=MMETSP0790-20130122/7951_1 /TAXON_ID=2925 /ORGANISM="Alexandrium catenella, Strain OF101" /LENGTH=125 /DNA_ID=CAMNT_0011633759 /DNA_START=68 /DNA_END=442 /DNA_ORIENTATION=-
MASKALLIPATFSCAAAFVAPQQGLRGAPAADAQQVGPALSAPQQASSTFGTTATLAGAAIAVGAAMRRRSGRAAASAVTMHATGIAINGFGRIGRQVARIAMKDPEVDLKLVNASYDAEYLAYQ